MGLSRVEDAAARGSVQMDGFNTASDVTSKVLSGEIDLNAVASGEGRPYFLEAIVHGTFTTAAGAALDDVTVTLTAEDSPTTGGAYTVRKTLVKTFIVNDDNNQKHFTAVLPVPLSDLTQFVKCSCHVEAGTGAPTVSVATAGMVIRYSAFSRDRLSQGQAKAGYGEATAPL